MMIFKTTLTTRQICTVGVILSVLFSLVVLLQKDLINNDGILYLKVADLLQKGQFSDAVALYGWPFFSLLIAAVDMITGAGLDSSAYILVTLFDAVLLVAFVLIVKELGGDTRVQIAAIVVIFSLAYMNENRADVIRDHGYWACYLSSLLLYLKFYRSPELWLALGWSATILLGALFRIEGFVVWAALPLVMLVRRGMSAGARMQYLFMSYLLHILIGVILISYLWITKDGSLLLATRLGDFKPLFVGLLDGLSVDMERRMSVLKTGVLNAKYSSGFARSSIIGILLIILGSKIITTVTPPYLGLFFISSLRTRLKRLDPYYVPVLVWAGIINLMIVLPVLIPRFFLPARLVLPFALTLLIFVPFMLVQALDNWGAYKEGRKRRITIIYFTFVLFILYGCLDGLISTSPSKSYIKESGLWIKQNLDRESKIYFNNPRIDHYAGRYKSPYEYVKLRPNMLYKFDYIVIKFKKTDAAGMNEVNNMASCLSVIKEFTGPREAMVKIYRVRHDNGCNDRRAD